jgi:hypothetical protein
MLQWESAQCAGRRGIFVPPGIRTNIRWGVRILSETTLHTVSGSGYTSSDVRVTRYRSRLPKPPGPALVAVDYVQCCATRTVTDASERNVSAGARGLEDLSGELEIPVLALAIARSRIPIIGAERPEDLALGHGDERPPLEHVEHDATRAFGGVTVDLDRTARDDRRALVNDVLDREPNHSEAPSETRCGNEQKVTRFSQLS